MKDFLKDNFPLFRLIAHTRPSKDIQRVKSFIPDIDQTVRGTRLDCSGVCEINE